MEKRPYLTSAEAATYCGFKTIGGIQQAVRRGKLKPAGRRGGTGTYVFATADLDLFLTGGLQPHERLFVAPSPDAGRGETVDTSPAPRRARSARFESPGPAEPQNQPPRPLPPSRRERKSAGKGEDPVARIVRALSRSEPDNGKKAKAQLAGSAGSGRETTARKNREIEEIIGKKEKNLTGRKKN